MTIAKKLIYTCYQMYNQMPTGLSPEIVHFNMSRKSKRDIYVKVRVDCPHEFENSSQARARLPGRFMCVDYLLTRTVHAYASLCSKRPAVLMGRAAQVSGVARLVGVQRAVPKNGNVNSEPKYLACAESPIRAFYF